MGIMGSTGSLIYNNHLAYIAIARITAKNGELRQTLDMSDAVTSDNQTI